MDQKLQTPRGTKDILPDEQAYWQFIEDTVREKAEAFGCGKINTPIFEYANVFNRSLGVSSDIVAKQMYKVSRAGEQQEKEETQELILRPEMTAPIARAYVEHGMKTYPQPVKLYYAAVPLFRYERPQAMRFRIHHQFGVEVIGDASAQTDSSMIFLAFQIYKKLGLSEIVVDINSVGCPTCRVKMKKKLTEYFEKFLPDMCEDCNRRFKENPLRILDCKEHQCQRFIESAPPMIDSLCSECKDHFKQVLENLDNLQIPYNLNARLVRGLDYYTKTVFEFFEGQNKENRVALGGGGRYDELLKLFGEPNTPAVGFGSGMERVIEIMKKQEVQLPPKKGPQVCIVQIGEKAQKMCLPLVMQLEENGISAACIMGKDSLKGQLRDASKMNAKHCLIIGQREVIDKTVIVRDMQEANQETIKLNKLNEVLAQKLGK